MSVHFHVLRTKHRASYTTTGGRGTMHLVRWEWGVGKGAHRRRLNKIAGEKWVRARYFFIGSRYEGTYSGDVAVVGALWEAL